MGPQRSSVDRGHGRVRTAAQPARTGLAGAGATSPRSTTGLRFFFTRADNRDITRRVELGHAHRPHVGATYQIDRGRFENYLTDELVELGVEVWTGHRVNEVDLGNGEHHVSVTTPDGEQRHVKAHWVVDASGRAAILKRKLGLTKPNGHNVNAAWFRVDSPVDIDQWSAEPPRVAREWSL